LVKRKSKGIFSSLEIKERRQLGMRGLLHHLIMIKINGRSTSLNGNVYEIFLLFLR
jgi:hypothetical protein